MSNPAFAFDYEEWVDINGDRQNIRVRTQDEGAPVILFLHGGPGMPNRNQVLHNQKPLAEKYTIVVWDQRASGKSWKKDSKEQELHVETYIQDCKAMVEYLCQKFGKEKIVVMGQSWGTIIGTPLVVRYPEHIAAYIGSGQFVEGIQNEQLSWQFCLDEAKRLGDTKAIKTLEECEPVNGMYPSQKAMTKQRDYLTRYGGACWKERSGIIQSIAVPFILYDGYHLKDLSKYVHGALYLTDILWPEAMKTNFFESAKEITVPVLLTIGKHDYNTPFELSEKWFDQLKAPYKKWVWFRESAHSPYHEEPEKWGRKVMEFLDLLQTDGQLA